MKTVSAGDSDESTARFDGIVASLAGLDGSIQFDASGCFHRQRVEGH